MNGKKGRRKKQMKEKDGTTKERRKGREMKQRKEEKKVE